MQAKGLLKMLIFSHNQPYNNPPIPGDFGDEKGKVKEIVEEKGNCGG